MQTCLKLSFFATSRVFFSNICIYVHSFSANPGIATLLTTLYPSPMTNTSHSMPLYNISFPPFHGTDGHLYPSSNAPALLFSINLDKLWSYLLYMLSFKKSPDQIGHFNLIKDIDTFETGLQWAYSLPYLKVIPESTVLYDLFSTLGNSNLHVWTMPSTTIQKRCPLLVKNKEEFFQNFLQFIHRVFGDGFPWKNVFILRGAILSALMESPEEEWYVPEDSPIIDRFLVGLHESDINWTCRYYLSLAHFFNKTDAVKAWTNSGLFTQG